VLERQNPDLKIWTGPSGGGESIVFIAGGPKLSFSRQSLKPQTTSNLTIIFQDLRFEGKGGRGEGREANEGRA